MNRQEFEKILGLVVVRLDAEVKANKNFHAPQEFENRARVVLEQIASAQGVKTKSELYPYMFPDIVFGEFGIEVKVTNKDTWRSVANSVFEGTRQRKVKYIYILFGKMGGTPSVQSGRYEDCVIHVRTSHVPRFEVEIGPKKSLFEKMNVSYEDFSNKTPEEKMKHVREYARQRLKPGERLWWLEDSPDQAHSLPLEVRLYMSLPQEEKRKLRAEAAILCPQIVKPSRTKNKYNDATIYILTYHGILCPQARDLFSAGSVALRSDGTRGGIYIQRALKDIEKEMRSAARYLEDALFVEYWGRKVKPADRIPEWLKRADEFATNWKPSKSLFLRK